MPEKTAIKSKSETTQTSRAASSPPARVPKTKEKTFFRRPPLLPATFKTTAATKAKVSVSAAGGSDALIGALASGGAEAAAPVIGRWLYGKGDGGSLSAEEKETVSAITRMLGTTAGAAVGNSAADAVRSGMAADGAVGNNFETIFTPQQGTEEKRTGKKNRKKQMNLLNQTNKIFLSTALAILLAIIFLLLVTILFLLIYKCIITTGDCKDIDVYFDLEYWKDIFLMYLKAITIIYPFCFLHVWNADRNKKDINNH